VAGIAALTITSSFLRDTRNELKNGQLDCCGADPADDDAQMAIEAGVRWLAHHFTVRSNPGDQNWLLYYLYGLERAGRMTGSRFFGDNDWYREGARRLVDNQDVRGGSWISEHEQDPVVGTSLGLLFISKGLAPVLINKLKFGPRDPRSGEVLSRDWNQHPRDAANLTEYLMLRPQWPKLITWQVVDLGLAAREEGVSALLQAPVQLMTGTDSPGNLPEEEVELLREYIFQGGFVLAIQNCDSVEFDDGFRRLIGRLFPDGQFQLKELPDTHDIYRSEFLLDKEPPRLLGVDLGCRTAIVYAPYDHACRWDRWMRTDPRGRAPEVKGQIDRSLKLGVNVVAYATGRELADKLYTPSVVKLDEDDPLNRGRLTVARIRHTGGWDTAPSALKHLKLALLNVGIEMSGLAPSIPATDETLFDYPVAYMHGRKNFSLTEAERDKLKAYLQNDGFLFADACCGARQFDASFRKLVEQLFDRPLERIPITHELFNNPVAHDIRQVKRRIPREGAPGAVVLAAEESVGEPVLEGLEIDGRYAIIYSKYDLSCALERQAQLACAGYPTADAAKIAVNIVLYAMYR
jgi:hypothetical protein